MDWIQLLTAGGAFTALGVALATWLSTRPKMKAVELQGEAALWVQIAKLQSEAKNEREECGRRIAILEAKVADVEHDLASETWNFDLFLAQAENDPDRIPELIPRIREERRQHKERMVQKRGVREAAVITGAKE